MAIKKDVEIGNTGMIASYLKIEDFSFSSDGDTLVINMGLYKDQASRDIGKSQIDLVVIKITKANDEVFSGANLTQMMYNKIKSLDAFIGAIDV